MAKLELMMLTYIALNLCLNMTIADTRKFCLVKNLPQQRSNA